MTTSFAETTAPKQRGRPFRKGQSGNPAGRPRGTRNKATLAAETLLDGEVEGVTRIAIELAKRGDPVALRLCFERLLPPRRERPVVFAMPALTSAADAPRAMAAIVEAVAAGELNLGEAAELSKLVSGYVEALEAGEFEARLKVLEEAAGICDGSERASIG